jgi:hypothetical protein
MTRATHRVVVGAVLAAFALALAGCGGGAEGDVAAAASEGAGFAPGSAAAFVEIDTAVDGNQWRQAEQLLDRFPGKDELFDDVRKELAEDALTWKGDVEPALGDALYLAWLDFANDGDNLVGFAKPANRDKFERLLAASNDPLAHRDVEGWTVFAESAALIDRFEQERSAGNLADEDVFKNALDGLPEDALVRAFVSGGAVQQQIDEELAENGASESLTDRFGKLESLAAATAAETGGLSLALDYASEGGPEVKSYSPSLPDSVPAGPLLYVSFGNLEEAFNRLVETLDEEVPEFSRQRAQAELALGLSIRRDLAPLFAKEGGFAVYPAEPSPAFALVLAVGDEDAARRLVDRLGALVELGGEGSTSVGTLEGVEVRTLTYEGSKALAAVSDGRLIVTTTEAAMRDFLDGGPALSSDPTFESASDATELPAETSGFVYAKLDDAFRELHEYLGDDADQRLRDNTEPLESLLLFAEQEGDHQRLSGFVEIQ